MSRHAAERWPIRWLKGRHTCLSRTLTLGMDFLQLPPPPFIELAVSPPSEQAWPPALTQGENRFRDQETCWRFTPEKHQLNNLTLSLAVTFASSGIILLKNKYVTTWRYFGLKRSCCYTPGGSGWPSVYVMMLDHLVTIENMNTCLSPVH